jgi:hypothetical protein
MNELNNEGSFASALDGGVFPLKNVKAGKPAENP